MPVISRFYGLVIIDPDVLYYDGNPPWAVEEVSEESPTPSRMHAPTATC